MHVHCRIIDKQDGVRLLWSLLKSPNAEVRDIISQLVDISRIHCYGLIGPSLCSVGYLSMYTKCQRCWRACSFFCRGFGTYSGFAEVRRCGSMFY